MKKRILSILLILVLAFSFVACGKTGNIEKGNIQKDRSVIAEIHYAIETALENSDYADAKPNSSAVNCKKGAIDISSLFASDEVSQALAEEVIEIIGSESYEFKSRMKKDCTMQIVVLDYSTGNVVLQVVSEPADEEYYIDSKGLTNGVYNK